jgi:hypothetical protein
MADPRRASEPDPSFSPAQPSPGSRPLEFGPDDVHALRQHLALCQEFLSLVERENQALRTSQSFRPTEFIELRKGLLPRLNQSYKKLEEVRGFWQRLSSTQRQQFPEVTLLLRQTQDIIMKIVLLDRENEQAMLRLGLAPSGNSPSANRQRPNFVAELYRRTNLR